MGITATARAQAQARVSKAEAEVAAVQAQINRAQASLESSAAAGGVLDSIKGVAVVGPLTAGMRDKSDVEQAEARAELDRLAAELSSAETRLDLARKAQAALLAVVGDE
jgi:outer membrane protein TolC